MAHDASRHPQHSQPINFNSPDPRIAQPTGPASYASPPQYSSAPYHQENLEARSCAGHMYRPEYQQQQQQDLSRSPQLQGSFPKRQVPNGPKSQDHPMDPRLPPSNLTARPEALSEVKPSLAFPPPPAFPISSIPAPPVASAGGASPGQPVDETLKSAPIRAHTAVPSELIAQITEDVIRRLGSTSLEGIAPIPPPPPPPPSHAQQQGQGRPADSSRGHSRNSSNTTSESSSSITARDAYTPPSPRAAKVEVPLYPPPPPRQGSLSSATPIPNVFPYSPRESGGLTQEQSPRWQASERVQPPPEHFERASRPVPDRRPTDQEETPMDRTWGQLFDESGNSTARLGQFLRGLANHIIDDFEPTHSIVVTPVKMARYYELCRLPSEIWPWEAIFRDLSSTKLSRLYQDLECQHHLVQDRHDSVPTIPGLTPLGFERWMTTMILARPEDEVRRLQKAVMEMPISNADNSKERFPKEISRRLFPKSDDRQAQDKIKRAFPAGSRAPPLAANRSEQARPEAGRALNGTAPLDRDARQMKLERERAPYCGPSYADSAIDDGPYGANGIERERKPYSGARRFESDLKPNPSAAAARPISTGRPRTQSTSSRVSDYTVDEDGMRYTRPPSVHNGPPPGRRRSPTLSEGGGGYRRQANDMLGYPEIGGPVDIGIDPRRCTREPDPISRARLGPDRDHRVNEGSPSRRSDYPRDRDRDRERYTRAPPDLSRGGSREGGVDEGYYR